MTGCVAASRCDLCSTSACSLKTIYCHCSKPGEEMRVRENGKRAGREERGGRAGEREFGKFEICKQDDAERMER